MNVAQMIAHLQTFPAYYEVVISKNMNGDCFSPVEKIGEAQFIPWTEPPFNNHMGELRVANKKHNNCVYLVPEA